MVFHSLPPLASAPNLRARSSLAGSAARGVGVALVLVLGVGGCGKKPTPGGEPPTVGVVTVEPAAVTLTTELPGRTSPYEIADVRPQVGGIVLARSAQGGP